MTTILWGIVIGVLIPIVVFVGHLFWVSKFLAVPCPLCKTLFDPTRPCGSIPTVVYSSGWQSESICPCCTAERQEFLESPGGRFPATLALRRPDGRRIEHRFPGRRLQYGR